MRIRIAIAAALALAGCDNAPDVTHYVLALSWQPAFCEFNRDRPECRALDGADFAASHLTVHGLWPNSGPGEGPSYCDVDAATKALDEPKSWCDLPQPEIKDKTRASLAPAMPGVASCLDRHEWIKHGTCSGMNAEGYFADTLRLAAAIQDTPLGRIIPANVGRYVTPRQLVDGFEVAFGAGASQALTLICKQGNGVLYLSEIRVALKPSSLEGALDRDDLYLSGPQPTGSCPDTMRIDSPGP